MVKIDLFPDEVYTFTPRGQVLSFPMGATPIDFAYAIHTEVGHHTTGAKVNGRIVPLRSTLNNGDIVEILTHPNRTPSRDWLGFAKTSRARSKIRAWLRQSERHPRDRARTRADRQAVPQVQAEPGALAGSF